MSLSIGTLVRSVYYPVKGTIVGYGSLCWPTSGNVSGDGGVMQPVYLVQVADGSSALGQAVVVLHAQKTITCDPSEII